MNVANSLTILQLNIIGILNGGLTSENQELSIKATTVSGLKRGKICTH